MKSTSPKSSLKVFARNVGLYPKHFLPFLGVKQPETPPLSPTPSYIRVPKVRVLNMLFRPLILAALVVAKAIAKEGEWTCGEDGFWYEVSWLVIVCLGGQ